MQETEEPKKPAKANAKDAPVAKKPARANAEDDDEYAPPKKKKRQTEYDEDEDEAPRSYKNSPLRYAVLGVLILTMLVMGYFLYEKRKKEREDAGAPADRDTTAAPAPPPQGNFNPPLQFPKGNKQPKVIVVAPPGGDPNNPLNGFFGAPPPATAAAQMQKFKGALVGKWSADLGNGVTQELTYNADGTFTEKLTGPTPTTASGKYTVVQVVGTKGVKVQLDTGVRIRFVTAVFEDDELLHPTLQPGVTGTFRKK